MKILGYDIKRAAPKMVARGSSRFEAISQVAAIHAAAPQLPMRRGDGALTEIMPPFGTNPPRMPVANMGTDMTSREITNDPRELWYLALPSKLTPRQVLTILRSALGGDIWQQWQLLSLMMDSWPMFRKCAHELREAVSNTSFIASAFTEGGDEATDSAKAKADLVTRSFASFNPDPFTDETGFNGMLYDLTDAMLNGLTMTEIMWQFKNSAKHGQEWLPRASAWVHPRHYTFSNDGRIAVFDADYTRMYSPLADKAHMMSPALGKFLVGQFRSRSGSSLGAGFMRPLAWYWSAVVFNREWMLNTAQKYGSVFLDATYKPGTPQVELNALDAMLESATTNRWMRHVEGTTIVVQPPVSTGTDNPQRFLMEEADKACMFLLLGQESTTKSTPGKLGGGDEKDKVKRERVEGLAKWVAAEPLTQFARAVIQLNYGSDDEMPVVTADFTEASDPMADAERDQIFLGADVPMLAEPFYKKHNLPMPEVGDLVIVGGKLGYLGEMADDLGAPPPLPDPNKTGMPAGDGEGTPVPIKVANARQGRSVKEVLRTATKEEKMELAALVKAAHAAPHVNGEIELVRKKITEIAQRRF